MLPGSEAPSISSAMHPKQNGAGKKVYQMYTVFDVMGMGVRRSKSVLNGRATEYERNEKRLFI